MFENIILPIISILVGYLYLKWLYRRVGGFFKNDDDLKIWITDDKNHIIVKGEAAIVVGAVKVELTDYSGLANSVSRVN